MNSLYNPISISSSFRDLIREAQFISLKWRHYEPEIILLCVRFQPSINYRTLEFDRPLSPRTLPKIVSRCAEFTGIGRVTPHDLRRTVVAKLLNNSHPCREVQMVTKYK